MAPRHDPEALTLPEYRQLEAAGRITRPLTDGPIGWHTGPKRNQDALASEIVTGLHADDWQVRPCPPGCICPHCQADAGRQRSRVRAARARARRKDEM